MKKIAFLVVSAVLACAGSVVVASEKISSFISGSDQQIEEQSQQPLVLQSTSEFTAQNSLLGHSSHSSHASHSSHRSHYSSR